MHVCKSGVIRWEVEAGESPEEVGGTASVGFVAANSESLSPARWKVKMENARLCSVHHTCALVGMLKSRR